MANEFAAWLHDAESRRVVRELDRKAAPQRGSVRQAVRACQAETSADVLLVDLDGEKNPLVHLAELLRVCRPQTMVVATGSENNVALANELYRSGVFLYLPKPLDLGDLRRAMAEVAAVRDESERPEIQASRLVLVHGKGMGMTTLTVLLARLAAARGRYVGCLDLDRNFGTLALAFDKRPERGLAQALREANGAAIDIDRLQTRVSSRIALLAHPFDQVGGPAYQNDSLHRLIDAMSAQAHLILACGATVAQAEHLRHLTTSHLIVFEPAPAGISIAARWLRVLDGAASTLVLNHARPMSALVGDEQLRAGLGHRGPDLVLPYIKRMAVSMALGEPEKAIGNRERAALDRILNPLVGIGSAENEA